MTLHWWMHWFWITSKLIFCISSAYSKPVTSFSVGNLEPFLIHNRPVRRNIKSVNQNLQLQSQVPTIPVILPTKNSISDTAINEILPQSYETNTTVTLNKCLYPTNSPNTSDTSFDRKNDSFFCNQTDSLLSKGDNALKVSRNLSVSSILVSEEEGNVTKQHSIDSNITTYLLTTNGYIDSEEENTSTQTSISSVSITGITFGVLMFAGLICMTSIMLYRRGFANKPQTLNDKCSNLDSSGYIDDSSIRENSEEMYSLDNDSFLNSLEAMTIQNYWTDNLKHTKL